MATVQVPTYLLKHRHLRRLWSIELAELDQGMRRRLETPTQESLPGLDTGNHIRTLSSPATRFNGPSIRQALYGPCSISAA